MAEIASFGVNVDQNTRLAQNAQDTANKADTGIGDLNDPNLMSVIEKQTQASQYAGLTSQYNVILARAKDDNISTTALTTAYTNLNTFMASILTDTTKASDVNRETYKSLTDAYNTALSNVQSGLSDSFNADIDNMSSSVSVASQAASSATIAASQAATTGNNASQVASRAIVVANDAQSAGNNATSVANNASQAASSAILAGSTATVSANKASSDYQALSAGVKGGSVVHITTETVIDKGVIGTAQIADLAVTNAQVGNVSANKLTAGTIDFNTITGKNINASNITTGTLSTDRLNVGKLSALSANLGDVTAGTLKGVDIVANTFSTPNGSFTTDANGAITANNMTINGGTLTSPTINASTIIGSDIQAAMIHSTDNSFSLDKDGNILGASIGSSPAATNAWNISKEGKISGASVTSSLIDITGDGSGPNFDAENVTPDTATGIYSRYKYTNPNVGFDVNGAGREMYKNGYLVINGDTFLNRTIGDWSADGGGKYVYDTMYEANVIKMRAYNYTGSDVQTDDPSKTQGVISSRLDIQPSAITMGPDFSVGNPNILINYTGRIKGGLIATNAAHSIGTTDGGDLYFMRMNKDATNVDGSSISIHANNYYTNNMGLSSGHVINSHDGGDVWLESGWGSGGNTVDLHVKKLYQSSLLSLKTDIKPIDPHEALTEVVKNDVMGYHFKNDKTMDPKSVSVILDDINPIPKYYTSDVFKSADGTGRNDGTIVGYLMLSIKDLNSRLQKLEGTN